MKCSECGSAAVSTGVADDVSCFDCGHHGPHKYAGEPSLHGGSFPAEASEPAAEVAEVDADASDGEEK